MVLLGNDHSCSGLLHYSNNDVQENQVRAALGSENRPCVAPLYATPSSVCELRPWARGRGRGDASNPVSYWHLNLWTVYPRKSGSGRQLSWSCRGIEGRWDSKARWPHRQATVSEKAPWAWCLEKWGASEKGDSGGGESQELLCGPSSACPFPQPPLVCGLHDFCELFLQQY